MSDRLHLYVVTNEGDPFLCNTSLAGHCSDLIIVKTMVISEAGLGRKHLYCDSLINKNTLHTRV